MSEGFTALKSYTRKNVLIVTNYSSQHEQIENNLSSCVYTHVQLIGSRSKSQTLTYQENKPIFDVLGMTTKEISCSFI